MPLRTRLTAAFVLVLLVPLLVAGVLFGALVPAALRETSERGLASSARLAASAVAELCARAVASAQAAAQAAGEPDGTALQDAVDRLVDRGLVDGVRVVDAAGASRAVAGTAPPVDEGDCTDGEVVRVGDEVLLAATERLVREGLDEGRVVAAVTVDDAVAVRLQQVAGRGDVVLLDGDEPVAASRRVDGELVRAALAADEAPVAVDGRAAVVAAARDQQPVGVLLTVDSLPDLGPVWLLLGVGLAGVLATATAIATGLARATTGPLEELDRAAGRIADGDLSTTIAVRSRDEVGRLAVTFNTMTEELRRYVAELQHSRDQLQAGVARLGEALSGTHDLPRILTVVLEAAQASTGSQGGAVLLLEPDTRELALSVGHGLAEHGVPVDLRVPLDAGVVGGVARTGAPVRGVAGTGRHELRAARGEPVGVPLVAVPLTSSSHLVGVLLLWGPESGGGYTDDDLATLRTFASQATVAVDNVQLHEEARRLSLTDEMTGLWNYRYFTMTVGKEIERAARFRRPLSLLVLDLDHFKLVNDVYGHPRGDAVLVELAARVRSQVRDVDVLARYGGEEFVAVLPETDRHGAVQAAERIRAAVRRRPFGEDGEQPVDVTVSIGVAVFPDHGASATTLLRSADEALYAAKRAGRDGWRLAAADAAHDGAPHRA